MDGAPGFYFFESILTAISGHFALDIRFILHLGTWVAGSSVFARMSLFFSPMSRIFSFKWSRGYLAAVVRPQMPFFSLFFFSLICVVCSVPTALVSFHFLLKEFCVSLVQFHVIYMNFG